MSNVLLGIVISGPLQGIQFALLLIAIKASVNKLTPSAILLPTRFIACKRDTVINFVEALPN
jgi:hypothetical protein